MLATRERSQVLSLMAEVESRVNADGLTAVGFVTYEAAGGFDANLISHDAGELPLVCFALFANAEVVGAPVQTGEGSGQLWRFTESANVYGEAIETIRKLIKAGDVYQINHTTRLRGLVNDPKTLFAEVAAGAPHAAYLECDSHVIVSASPECFFSIDGERIFSQPMKGTAARNQDPKKDRAQRDWLAASTKNQAENLMITDMVRNDLGRIAEPGTVTVSELFAMEDYPTVWQMTSRIEAQTRASVTDIFRQLFPAASITGAPKRAAMEHIRSLEPTPREIYTGAIGYIAPNRRAQFNIAIRTAWISKGSQANYGAGGGVVWDSRPEEEYQELVSKTQILKQATSWDDFALFETMAWTAKHGATHLDLHLQRMAKSAGYFGIAFDATAAVAAIAAAVRDLQPTADDTKHRLRLELNGSGEFNARLSAAPQGAYTKSSRTQTQTQTLALVPWRVNSKDPALAHKTTQRQVYVRGRETVTSQHGPEVEPLLANERGEITETDIANVVFCQGGRHYTPPVSCGLLPGVLRETLLKAGTLEERILRIEDLVKVEAIYLINDLRGWRRAKILDASIMATASNTADLSQS